MDQDTVLYEKKGKIGLVTLNRPEVLNAMNARLWKELEQVLDSAAQDKEVKVLVFTGQGRAFSTGADLKDSKNRSMEDYRRYLESLQAVSKKLIRFEKPTLAAINGYALGSGYELALACDIRLAGQEVLIGSPEARVTSSVTGGAFSLLQNLVGPGRAKELLFTADYITGRQAELIGLVNKAVPLEDLMDETMAMAEKISDNSAISLTFIKKGCNLAQEGENLESLMDFEVEACLACVATKDRKSSLDKFEQRKQKKEE